VRFFDSDEAKEPANDENKILKATEKEKEWEKM